jgi:hypothetical protein
MNIKGIEINCATLCSELIFQFHGQRKLQRFIVFSGHGFILPSGA